MAGSLAQCRVNAGTEAVQQIKGNKGLHRSGEAAAVDTAGAPPVEVMLAKPQGYSHILMGGVTGGGHVL